METASTTGNRGKWCALGLLLTLAGGVVYGVLLGQPFSRSTGLPTFVLMLAGVAIGLYAAAGDRRGWVRVAAGVDVLLLAGFAGYLFVFARLPASAQADLAMAPDFTLPDHEKQDITLSEQWARGPVLLVFYRGHW